MILDKSKSKKITSNIILILSVILLFSLPFLVQKFFDDGQKTNEEIRAIKTLISDSYFKELFNVERKNNFNGVFIFETEEKQKEENYNYKINTTKIPQNTCVELIDKTKGLLEKIILNNKNINDFKDLKRKELKLLCKKQNDIVIFW